MAKETNFKKVTEALALLKRGKSAAKVAVKLKVSVGTVYRWKTLKSSLRVKRAGSRNVSL